MRKDIEEEFAKSVSVNVKETILRYCLLTKDNAKKKKI